MLETNQHIEAALSALGSPVRKQIKKGRDGNDDTIIRTMGISDLPAKFMIPKDAVIGEMPAGTVDGVDYTIYYVDVHPEPNSVRVHFHKGLRPVPGEYAFGQFIMLGKAWNPCDERGEDLQINRRNGKNTRRNYGPLMDVHPCEEQGRHELVIYDTSADDYSYAETGRTHPWEVSHFMWAFQNGFGNQMRDQHIAFVEERRPRRTAMSEALQTAGVVGK